MPAKTKSVPRSACAFRSGVPIRLAAGDAEQQQATKVGGREFSMVVNTGRIMNHDWWGQFAIDLEGVEPPAGRIGALMNHDQRVRVGYAEGLAVTDSGLEAVGGRLLDNADAARLASDSDQGFPFQASPFVEPLVLEEVEPGASVEVNGQTMEGPGTVFRQSRMHEISFVSVGVDSDTSSAVLGEDGRGTFTALLQEPNDMAAKKKTAKKVAPKKGRALGQAADNESAEETTETEEAPVEPEVPEEETEETPADVVPPSTDPTDAGGQDAAQLERQRASTILDAAGAGQAKLAKQLIADGVGALAALQRLQADSQTRLSGLVGEADEPLGAGNSDEDDDAVDLGNIDEGCEDDVVLDRRWKASEALRKEFHHDEGAFRAYEKAVARGTVEHHAPRLSLYTTKKGA